MDLGLLNRHALVAGASRGLGRAVASALAAEGAQVVAVARSLERLNELAAAAPAGRGTITARACDLSDASSIDGLAGLLQETDILVLNTGGPAPGAAADISDAVWSRQFEAMFLSAIRLTRLALPGMRERGFGRILAIVSSGVIQPIANLGVSNALRSALVAWAKTLAGEVAGEGVTVNCIAPGRIATDRVAELDRARSSREGVDIAQVERESRALIPAGRYGDAAEFASVAAFLASPRASYMTGGVIRVDGGMIRSV
ncbi:MAG TPA: SDR family oxidoreductase [Steroidobacteraceae bacterium]|jgi:3-oxoacyl-[acyl-carrier protein] reductase|nr:SDR family oxidoreductase [Steroidobacteraceae bacterium]